LESGITSRFAVQIIQSGSSQAVLSQAIGFGISKKLTKNLWIALAKVTSLFATFFLIIK